MADHYTEKVYLSYSDIEAIKDALEIALRETYDNKLYRPLIDKFQWLLYDPDWINSEKDHWKRR